MSDLPKTREELLKRIEEIDAELMQLTRRAIFDGVKDWPAWDKLHAERVALEKQIWGARPHNS